MRNVLFWVKLWLILLHPYGAWVWGMPHYPTHRPIRCRECSSRGAIFLRGYAANKNSYSTAPSGRRFLAPRKISEQSEIIVAWGNVGLNFSIHFPSPLRGLGVGDASLPHASAHSLSRMFLTRGYFPTRLRRE